MLLLFSVQKCKFWVYSHTFMGRGRQYYPIIRGHNFHTVVSSKTGSVGVIVIEPIGYVFPFVFAPFMAPFDELMTIRTC